MGTAYEARTKGPSSLGERADEEDHRSYLAAKPITFKSVVSVAGTEKLPWQR